MVVSLILGHSPRSLQRARLSSVGSPPSTVTPLPSFHNPSSHAPVFHTPASRAPAFQPPASRNPALRWPLALLCFKSLPRAFLPLTPLCYNPCLALFCLSHPCLLTPLCFNPLPLAPLPRAGFLHPCVSSPCLLTPLPRAFRPLAPLPHAFLPHAFLHLPRLPFTSLLIAPLPPNSWSRRCLLVFSFSQYSGSLSAPSPLQYATVD